MPLITGVGWFTVSGRGRGRKQHDFHMADGPLPPILRKSVFDKPYQHFGRMDPFSKLGVAAIALALRDAGLEAWTEKRDMGIMASTAYGCLSTDIDYFDTVMPENGQLASPALFAYTLPNTFLGEAACRFGLTGPCYVINEAHLWGMECLRAAVDGIHWNEFEKGLAGFCNPACPPEIHLEHEAVPGAAFVVIEKTPGADRRPYGALRLDRDGTVFFNGKMVEDVIALIQACLSEPMGLDKPG